MHPDGMHPDHSDVRTRLGTCGEHISRQNYGYKLQKKGEALIMSRQVSLIFHIVLPNFDLQGE